MLVDVLERVVIERNLSHISCLEMDGQAGLFDECTCLGYLALRDVDAISIQTLLCENRQWRYGASGTAVQNLLSSETVSLIEEMREGC